MEEMMPWMGPLSQATLEFGGGYRQKEVRITNNPRVAPTLVWPRGWNIPAGSYPTDVPVRLRPRDVVFDSSAWTGRKV